MLVQLCTCIAALSCYECIRLEAGEPCFKCSAAAWRPPSAVSTAAHLWFDSAHGGMMEVIMHTHTAVPRSESTLHVSCSPAGCFPAQVVCITSFDQEPYVLLGCNSGAVRVAALVNASGDAVTGARQVRALQLREYTSCVSCRLSWHSMLGINSSHRADVLP
jgi:hypothetical protein